VICHISPGAKLGEAEGLADGEGEALGLTEGLADGEGDADGEAEGDTSGELKSSKRAVPGEVSD